MFKGIFYEIVYFLIVDEFFIILFFIYVVEYGKFKWGQKRLFSLYLVNVLG